MWWPNPLASVRPSIGEILIFLLLLSSQAAPAASTASVPATPSFTISVQPAGPYPQLLVTSTSGLADLQNSPDPWNSFSWLKIKIGMDPKTLRVEYKTISFFFDQSVRETEWSTDGAQEPPNQGASHIVKVMMRLQGTLASQYALRYRTWTSFFNVHSRRDNGWVEPEAWSDDSSTPAPTTWISAIQIALTHKPGDNTLTSETASGGAESTAKTRPASFAVEVLTDAAQERTKPTWLAPDPSLRSIPDGSENDLILVHQVDDGGNTLAGKSIEDNRATFTMMISVSRSGNASSSLEPDWIRPGTGLKGPFSQLHATLDSKDELGFLVGDAISKVSAKNGDLVAVTVKIQDSEGKVVAQSGNLYFRYFKPWVLYDEVIPGLPGLHFAALNTYSISTSNWQVSINPAMIAWGGKGYVGPDFYFGLSLAGFLTITPDVNNPLNSNIQQATVAAVVDINNLISLGVGYFFDIKNLSGAINMLASIDPGLLQILKGK